MAIYSIVPDDLMGKGIDRSNRGYYALGTGRGAVSVQTLEQDFFHGTTDVPGVEGTAALWTTEPGRQRVTFEIVTREDDFDRDTFKIWDGEKLLDLADRAIADDFNGRRWSSGDITLEFDTVSDEWGFLALDTEDRRGTSHLRIKSVEWLEDVAPSPYPLGSLYETSPDALTAWQYQNTEQVGTFSDPLTGQPLYDPVDRFDVPLGYDEGIEGWIAAVDDPVQLNIYNSVGDVAFSETIGSSSAMGFNFSGGLHQVEVLPLNPLAPTTYNIGWEVGQVYDAW